MILQCVLVFVETLDLTEHQDLVVLKRLKDDKHGDVLAHRVTRRRTVSQNRQILTSERGSKTDGSEGERTPKTMRSKDDFRRPEAKERMER